MRLLTAALVAGLAAAPSAATAEDNTPADFAGLHLGLDMGYGLGVGGDWCLCSPIPLGADAVGGDGGILVGGEAGYGVRFGPIVLDAAVRLSYADIDFAEACPGIGTCSGELAWLGEAVATAGVVVFDDILLAASVGYAAGDVSVVAGFADDTSTHDGRMLGGRVEFGMPGGWRMGVEYRYYDMAGTNLTASGPVEIEWQTESVSFTIRYEL